MTLMLVLLEKCVQYNIHTPSNTWSAVGIPTLGFSCSELQCGYSLGFSGGITLHLLDILWPLMSEGNRILHNAEFINHTSSMGGRSYSAPFVLYDSLA